MLRRDLVLFAFHAVLIAPTRIRIGLCAAMFLCAATPSIADAAPGDLLRTIENPTPQEGEEFGYSVAPLGENILIGAPRDRATIEYGAVYLISGSTGELLQRFLPPVDSYPGRPRFGREVIGLNDRVFVGLKASEPVPDAVYEFDAETGSLVNSYYSPGPSLTDGFGDSIGVTEEYLVVGAPDDSTSGAFAGAAYLFDVTNGDLLRTFTSPNSFTRQGFGTSVAVTENLVLIGTSLCCGGTDPVDGSAYLFDANTGNLLYQFSSPSPSPSIVGDGFGRNVTFIGNDPLISAQTDLSGDTIGGAVYLFDSSTGDLVQSFFKPMPESNDFFGHSLGSVGGNVLVGDLDSTIATYSGQVYLFDTATGDLLQTFSNPRPSSTDRFGSSVAGLGNSVIVGAHYEDLGASNAGAVYLFEGLSPPPVLLLGDMDIDYDVDFDDIDDFVMALQSEATYEATYGVPATLHGDMDGSGNLDFDDIDDFVAKLNGSLVAAESIPEPSSEGLALLAGLLAVAFIVRVHVRLVGRRADALGSGSRSVPRASRKTL